MSESTVLAAKLSSEGEKIVNFFSGLEDSQWGLEIYTEGGVWTVRNILAHLMTTERAFVKLFEDIRLGGQGVSEDFVIDRYNARQQEKTSELTPAELTKQYQTLRAEMVTWVSRLNDVELEKTARHPFLGVTSLREMVKMLYIHNQTHCRDIKKIIGQQPRDVGATGMKLP